MKKQCFWDSVETLVWRGNPTDSRLTVLVLSGSAPLPPTIKFNLQSVISPRFVGLNSLALAVKMQRVDEDQDGLAKYATPDQRQQKKNHRSQVGPAPLAIMGKCLERHPMMPWHPGQKKQTFWAIDPLEPLSTQGPTQEYWPICLRRKG